MIDGVRWSVLGPTSSLFTRPGCGAVSDSCTVLRVLYSSTVLYTVAGLATTTTTASPATTWEMVNDAV